MSLISSLSKSAATYSLFLLCSSQCLTVEAADVTNSSRQTKAAFQIMKFAKKAKDTIDKLEWGVDAAQSAALGQPIGRAPGGGGIPLLSIDSLAASIDIYKTKAEEAMPNLDEDLPHHVVAPKSDEAISITRSRLRKAVQAIIVSSECISQSLELLETVSYDNLAMREMAKTMQEVADAFAEAADAKFPPQIREMFGISSLELSQQAVRLRGITSEISARIRILEDSFKGKLLKVGVIAGAATSALREEQSLIEGKAIELNKRRRKLEERSLQQRELENETASILNSLKRLESDLNDDFSFLSQWEAEYQAAANDLNASNKSYQAAYNRANEPFHCPVGHTNPSACRDQDYKRARDTRIRNAQFPLTEAARIRKQAETRHQNAHAEVDQIAVEIGEKKLAIEGKQKEYDSRKQEMRRQNVLLQSDWKAFLSEAYASKADVFLEESKQNEKQLHQAF